VQKYISGEREIPPILMFHGTEDGLVFIKHSRSLFHCLKQLNKEAAYYEIKNEDHGSASFWGKDILDIVERFINKTRRK
jgi:dipeptidyl aminopeptidase/acylaminoacyl peptidase